MIHSRCFGTLCAHGFSGGRQQNHTTMSMITLLLVLLLMNMHCTGYSVENEIVITTTTVRNKKIERPWKFLNAHVLGDTV